MAENINDKKVFSLFETLSSIQKTLAERYKSSFWVKAEMNKLNFYSHSGNCYPELIEKRGGKVIAQIKSNLWKDDFAVINNKFLNVLKEPLKDGIKILFLAKVSFDPVYGLSLRIIDIDPAYTLGDLEREKQETIRRLKDEDIFNRNKTLPLPLLPQRIAIVSVETSKGYADFLKVLETNPWGYKFFDFLFPSLLQGEKAIDAIIDQLQRIRKVITHFDVVAIIRGGGGDVGLSCYNDYTLAKEISLFPIPVITGIGHATNETVVEMISYCNGITPTKIAEFLLQKFHDFSFPLKRCEEKIVDKSKRLISEQKSEFSAALKLFRSVTENILIHNRSQVKQQTRSLFQQAVFTCKSENDQLHNIKQRIKRNALTGCHSEKAVISRLAIHIKKDVLFQLNRERLVINRDTQFMAKGSATGIAVSYRLLNQVQQQLAVITIRQLKSHHTELDTVQKNVSNMDPSNVLKRGYSITRRNGKLIKSLRDVTPGDRLDTIVFEGNISSIVTSSQNKDEE